MSKVPATKRRKYMNYEKSHEALIEAVQRIKKGELSTRAASIQYNIPKSTLFDKVNHRTPLLPALGRGPYLTPEEENAITKWTIRMDRLGFGPTKKDIQEVVKQILDKNGRSNPFKDNRPGGKWFQMVKRRNPGFICRKEKPKFGTDVDVPPSMMDTWFDGFLEYLEEINARSILNEPTRLYKCEESYFEFDDVNGPQELTEVQAAKASKCPRDTQVTTLLAVSAEGSIPPPLIVMPGKKFLRPYLGKDGSAKGAILARNQTGVMDSDAFLKFLKNIFHPFLIKKKVPRPVLMFVNEQSKIQSPEISSFCKDRDILLYPRPPHAGYECQLSKLFVAECLNVDWGYVLNPECHVSKRSLPSIIFEAWENLKDRPSVGINEFKAIGVYPFTRVYSPTVCAPSMSTTSRQTPSTKSTSKDPWPIYNDDSSPGGSTAQPLVEETVTALSPTVSAPSTILMMSTMSRPTSSTKSTSKEPWPISNDDTISGGSTAQPLAEKTLTALRNRASSDDTIVIVPGREPVRVSPTTSALLSRVVGALEENGSITFHMEKQQQDDDVQSSQVTDAGKKTREVPEELWDKFQRFMAKEDEKKQKKAMKKKDLKKKAMKKIELKKKALKEKKLKKANKNRVLKVSINKPKLKKRKDDESDEWKPEYQRKRTKQRSGKAKTKSLPRKDDPYDSGESSDDTGSSESSDDTDSSESDDDDNICIECDEGGDMSGWISCSYCTSWVHLDCSEVYGLSLEEAKLISYKCKYCR